MIDILSFIKHLFLQIQYISQKTPSDKSYSAEWQLIFLFFRKTFFDVKTFYNSDHRLLLIINNM